MAADWSRWDFRKPELFAEIEHRFSPMWNVRFAWSRVQEDSDYKTATEFGAVDPATMEGTLIRSAGIEEHRAHQNGLDVTLAGHFSALGRRHDVILGASYPRRRGVLRDAGLSLGPFPIDVFDFDPRSIPEPATPAWTAEYQDEVRQSGIYARLRLNPVERLTLSAGARWSDWWTSSRDLVSGDESGYELSGELTPYGAVMYDVGRHESLYASYSEIFRPQNSYTSDGELLPPVVGTNYEVGLKGEWWDGGLNASFALFRIDQSNRAQEDPAHPSPCADSPTGTCSIAEGEVRSEGVEAELTGRLAPNLERLLAAVRDDVYNLALKMLWHPADAEDATQEILIRVLTGLGGYRAEAAFTTWVFRIATNHLLTTRKRRMEQHTLSFDEFADDLADGFSSDGIRGRYSADAELRSQKNPQEGPSSPQRIRSSSVAGSRPQSDCKPKPHDRIIFSGGPRSLWDAR